MNVNLLKVADSKNDRISLTFYYEIMEVLPPRPKIMYFIKYLLYLILSFTIYNLVFERAH